MSDVSALRFQRQFSLAYLLTETALIAVALAAGRLALAPLPGWPEIPAAFFCISLIAACGAVGGLCFRMAVGLIGGAIFAVASIPLFSLLLAAQ